MGEGRMQDWLLFLLLFGGLALWVLMMFARQLVLDYERYDDPGDC